MVQKLSLIMDLGAKFGFDEYLEIKLKAYCSFCLTQAFASIALMGNEGMSKEGKLFIDQIYEHTWKHLDEVVLVLTIWFKPIKKEGAENTFLSQGSITGVYHKDDVTFIIFTGTP